MSECIQHADPLTGLYCGPECDRLTRAWLAMESAAHGADLSGEAGSDDE